VLTRRVRLHLRAEIRGVAGEPLAVGLPYGLKRLLAFQAGGCRVHHLERPAQAALDRRHEELLLRAEEAEDVRLRDPGSPGDCLGRAAVEPMSGELDERRLEDLVAALRG